MAANQHWTLYNATPEFGAGTRVDVQGGRFDAYATVLAPEAGANWAGVRYAPNSSGDLADGTAIEGVSGFVGYALDVNDATLTIDEVTIGDPAPSSIVTGLYVRGSNADVTANQLTIRDMTSRGVLNTSVNGSLRLTNSVIEFSGNNGLSAGYLSETFLHPDFAPGVSPYLGVRFEENTGDGVRASSSADVVFGYYYYPTSVPHNDGFNSIIDGQAEGIDATSYATIYGGGVSFWQRNRLFGNVGLDARTSGSGTSAALRCNWWNDTTPPFRTASVSSATLDDSHWLVADPYQSPDAACVSGTFGGGKTGTLSRRTDTPSSQLADALAAFDRPALAVEALIDLVAAAPTSNEAAAAVRAVGRIASLPEAPVSARLTLTTWAGGPPSPLRDAALAALVSVFHRAEDPSHALEYADALAGEAATASGALFGAIARVYLLVDLDRHGEALEALALAQQRAPESDEVALAALVLGDETGERRSNPFSDSKARAGEEPEVTLAPNPTRDRATLAFTLDATARVRVAVYDVLGRQVALAHDGPAQAGEQSVDLDTSRLSPGAYIVQFEMDGTDLGGVRSQQALRLTVVR